MSCRRRYDLTFEQSLDRTSDGLRLALKWYCLADFAWKGHIDLSIYKYSSAIEDSNNTFLRWLTVPFFTILVTGGLQWALQGGPCARWYSLHC